MGEIGHSATPIYDALYAEYRRSFRTLPGDRSGEEDLVFTGFGAGPGAGRHDTRHGSGHAGHGFHGQHRAPRGDARHDSGPGHGAAPATGVWQAVGRRHGFGSHFPAALPPAPRRER
ncbi:hypothetical protein ACWD4J_05830 [Streptomyces sp. NPDC002577]